MEVAGVIVSVGVVCFILGYAFASLLVLSRRDAEEHERCRQHAEMFARLERAYIRRKKDATPTEKIFYTWINKGLDLAYQTWDEERWLGFFKSEARALCY